MYQTKTYQSGQ